MTLNRREFVQFAVDLRGAYQVRGTSTQASRLAAIVESSDDAIVAKDLDGIITSWNNGANGYSAMRRRK